jgi:hypothetical protein
MADKATARDLLISCFDTPNDPTRQMLERKWERNILYDMGEQWLTWLEHTQAFVGPGKGPLREPTPVANMIRQAKKSIRALVLNKDFAVRVWAASNEQTDKDAAKLAEDVIKWMDARRDGEFEDEKELLIDYMSLFGTAFMRVFPGTAGDNWGLTGSGDIVANGDVLAEVYTPFQMVVDTMGYRLRHKRWIGAKTLKDKEWVEDTFKVKLSADSSEHIDEYERRLSRLVGQASHWKGSGINYSGSAADDSLVLFKEIECRPTREYPEGRYILGVGTQVLKEYKQMPIPVENGWWSYSFVDFHYNRVPGRFWSDAAVDDLIGPQTQINKIDQSLENNRNGVGRPTIVMPKGSELKRKNKGGIAHIEIEWDPQASNFVEPKIQYGKPLPSQVMEARQNLMMAAQDASGDPKNVLRGQAPSSQASGLMVDILRDTAEQSHMPDIRRFYRSLRRVYKLRLILAQDVYDENTLIKIPGKGNEVYVKAFSGKDLRGNTDVRLELTSGLSTTNYGKTQTIMELAKQGIFGDLSQDPKARGALLKQIGFSDEVMADEYIVDTERASWENSLIANVMNVDDMRRADPAEMPELAEGAFIWLEIEGDKLGWKAPWVEGLYIRHIYPPDERYGEKAGQEVEIIPKNSNFPQGEAAHYFRLDDHRVHHETHRRFILSKQFAELHPICRRLMLLHDEMHQAEITKAEQAQQVQAMRAEQEAEAEKLRKKAGTDNLPVGETNGEIV